MYIYTCIYIYVYVHSYIYVCIYTYICLWMYVYIYIYTYMLEIVDPIRFLAGAVRAEVRDDNRLHVRRQQGAHGEVVVIAISHRER